MVDRFNAVLLPVTALTTEELKLVVKCGFGVGTRL